MKTSPIFGAALCLRLVSAYTWPNPQLDELESQRYDRVGYNARKMTASVKPCSRFDFGVSGGRSNAADWIRTAYHDMATFNSADGTGGMDASVRLERDRAENVGDAIANTLSVANAQANRYVSLADELALAAVIANEECGSPQIDFRGGRVDATTANDPGVPQPQDTLDSHTANFARQGFNQTEMISLVACGHTFGGVQHAFFPDIVPPINDPSNTQGQVLFDSTGNTFDPNVLTRYLDGSTQSPLIVGFNDTTNSDKRIFGSDGNVTVNRLTDPTTFGSTCATLTAKMLNSVPKGVQLTDIIEPLQVKPSYMQLVHGNGSLVQLSGQVRFWNMQENPNRVVKLLWSYASGQSCSNCTATLSHTASQSSTFTIGNLTSLWYSFMPPSALVNSSAITLDDSQPVSKIWFTVDEGDGNPVTQDQSGVGFVLQDSRLMLSNATCMGRNITIAAAVKKGSNPKRVYIKADTVSEMNGTAISFNAIPVLKTYDIPQPSTDTTQGNYDVWSLTFANSDWANGPFNIAADFDDGTIETPFMVTPQYTSCRGVSAVTFTSTAAVPGPTSGSKASSAIVTTFLPDLRSFLLIPLTILSLFFAS